MGIFKKVKDAKPTGSFDYFEPDAEWVVLVTGMKADETRKNVPFVATSCRVIETTCDRVRPGAERSWFVDMTKDASPGNIKQFAIEATGTSDEEFDAMSAEEVEEACDALVGEDQPCANLIIGLKTKGITTRQNTPFTVHTWTRLPDDKVRAAAAKARELGILSGPLCDMQAHLEEKPKKGKAA